MTAPSIGYLLWDVMRLVRKQYQSEAGANCLTIAQAKALSHIARCQGVKQVELAELLEIKPMSLVRVIDSLVEEGLVERRPDQRSPRSSNLPAASRGCSISQNQKCQQPNLGRSITGTDRPASRAVHQYAGTHSQQSLQINNTYQEYLVCLTNNHRRLHNLYPNHAAKPNVLYCFSGAVLALAGSVAVYLHGGRYVETDNAYVKADKTSITAEVSGRIINVPVEENQQVKAGDLLLQIDPTSYEIAVSQARANLNDVSTSLTTLKAEYQSKLANIDVSKSQHEYLKKEEARQLNL